MSSIFRHLTLHRIGAGLFVAGLVLLVGGAAGVGVSAASAGAMRLVDRWAERRAGVVVGSGLPGLVWRFCPGDHAGPPRRVEAQLDALARERALRNSPPHTRPNHPLQQTGAAGRLSVVFCRSSGPGG